jgi:hypothetical protein
MIRAIHLLGHVAEIETFEKGPARRVHRHYGIQKIVDPKDKTSEAFEVSKSRDKIRTVHHKRTRGGDQRNRKISPKESAIGISEIGESRSQKSSSSGFTKSRFVISRQDLDRQITGRSGPSDHRKI